jgi:AcrR family transcriptional regulator
MRLPAAERRQQLLDVAVGVFATSGFHNTSMNDVAIAAGVTKPVLYQHFDSKRALYLEMLREIGGQLRDTIAKATVDAPGPRQQIEGGFRAYFAFVAEHGDAFRVLFGAHTRRDDEFAEEARRVEASLAEIVAEHIEIEGLSRQDRLLLGNGIVGLAEGACRYWLQHEVDIDASTLSEHASRLAWAGLRGITP